VSARAAHSHRPPAIPMFTVETFVIINAILRKE